MKKPIHALVVSAALAVARLGAAEASPPPPCDVRLSLHLTPDAADPKEQGFLDTLLADPLYRLRWLRGTDTEAVVELTGPASDRHCRDGVHRLGMSSFVLDVRVLPK